MGTGGYTARFHDGTWSEVNSGFTDTLYHVDGLTPDNVWALGANGRVIHFDGKRWTDHASDTLNILRGLSVAADPFRQQAFGVGDNGTIIHWNGKRWKLQSSSTHNHLYAVWCASTTDCWATGQGGVILHYNGTSWATQPSGTNLTLYSIFGTDVSDIYVVGPSGTLLGHDGRRWQFLRHRTDADLQAVWAWDSGAGATYLWIGTDQGLILQR